MRIFKITQLIVLDVKDQSIQVFESVFMRIRDAQSLN